MKNIKEEDKRLLSHEKRPRGSHKDLTGMKFNRLTVVKFHETAKNSAGQNRFYWLCKCDCGAEAIIESYSITSGKAKSCGCLRIELNRKRAYNRAQRYKGFTFREIAELMKASIISVRNWYNSGKLESELAARNISLEK